MSATKIRPMTPADVDSATALVLAGDWGDRREFFDFAASHAACRPIVAIRDGSIVGTGVGTISGSVGWIGSIFVSPEARGHGVGRALTEATHDALAAAGCRTEVLVATEMGRPLYERIGFDVQCWYRTLEAPGLAAPGLAAEDPATNEADTLVRPFTVDDLETMADLDAQATGEDRHHLLAAFADPTSARCLADSRGTVRGFVVRAPWGGGATIAPDPEDAFRILDARRHAAGPGRRVRAGVIDVNLDGLRRLERAGWTEAWRATRMIRGESLRWRPEWLWGQFNHALG